MIVLSVILTAVIVTSFFIVKQSEAITKCDQRLKEIDDKEVFYSDDQIGWFFKEVQKIQEALNEFTLK